MSQTETKQAGDIIMILDESGSMSSMGVEPINACNEFIRQQKELDGNSRFSMYTFDSDIKQRYNEVLLSEVPEFHDYSPNTCTALYDCIHTAITNKKSTGRLKNVCMVIITDGLNNASKITRNEIVAEISQMEKEHNWQVIYLAANQDAFSVGESMGMTRKKCKNFNQGRGGDLMNAVRGASAEVFSFRQNSQNYDVPRSVDLNK